MLARPYQFDVGDYGLALLDTGPIARMNQFFSDSIRNRSGYASEDMDEALRSLEVAAPPDEIVAAMAEIQTMWNQDIPSIVYDASEWFIFAQERVEGLIFTRDVTVMFQDAYIAD